MSVQALDRAFDILELLSKEQHGPSLTDISRRLRLHKSTVYRFLQGDCRLGMQFIELSSIYLNNLELKTEAQPLLLELARLTANTVFLAILQDDEVVYIDKTETVNSLRKYSIIARRAPLRCSALGKAMLSGRSDAEIRAWFQGRELTRYTPATLTAVQPLLKEMAKTRRRGWSLDDEEYEPGVRCIGAAIRDYRAQVIAAVSTSGSLAMISRQKVDEIGGPVSTAALEISRRMGYRGQ